MHSFLHETRDTYKYDEIITKYPTNPGKTDQFNGYISVQQMSLI